MHTTTSSSPDRARRTIVVCALLALISFAAVVRLRPVGSTLPHRIVFDEMYHLLALQKMRGDPEVARKDPLFATYPHFVPRLAWLIAPEPPATEPGPLDSQLLAASQDVLLLRRICAALAVLIVPGTFLLARRFLDRRGALLAAALIATSLLSIWYSSQARPHGPGSAFGLLAVVAALELRRRPTIGAYVVAGCAAGAAMGSLQTGIAVLPALVLAHALRDRTRARSASFRLSALCIPLLLIVVVLCPSWFRAENRFLAPVELDRALFDGGGAIKLARGLWHFEPVLLGLGLGLGLIAIGRFVFAPRAQPAPERGNGGLRVRLRGREDLAIVLAHALPYALAIALYERANQRYFLPLLPYAVCIVASLVVRGSDRLVRPSAHERGRTLLRSLPAAALVLVQGALALRMNSVSVSPDTAVSAARWVEANLDHAHDRIVVPPNLDLPLLRAPEALEGDPYVERKPTPWATHQAGLRARERGETVFRLRSMSMKPEERARVETEPARYAHELQAEYAVVEVSAKSFVSQLVRGIRAEGELVARFSPMRTDDGDDTPFLWWDQQNEYEEGFSWLWRMLHARSLGSVIEIYQLRARPPE